MANLPQITEDIRTLISAGDLGKTMRLEQLARDLADESRPILDRIRRCEEYLQKGLRSEAIQLAKTEPDLLDSINLLEFQDRDLWDQTMSLYGLPIAARPSQESAAALNQAYSDEEPLKPLLKKHRLLALSRAPYLERMNVIREMLRIDPSNIAFQEDLSIFELWRIESIRSEIAEAKKNFDLAKILDLLNEVDNTHWVNPLPPNIVKEIRTIGAKARRESLSNKANAMLPQILFARKNKDEDRCRQMLAEIEQLGKELGWTSSDQVFIQLGTVYSWLKSLDEKRNIEFEKEIACGELEELLAKKDVTEETLVEKMNLIERLGPLPQGLERQCNDRLSRMRWERVRKEYTILGIALAIGAIALVVFVIVIITRSRGQG
jgi:hypothetical protein